MFENHKESDGSAYLAEPYSPTSTRNRAYRCQRIIFKVHAHRLILLEVFDAPGSNLLLLPLV